MEIVFPTTLTTVALLLVPLLLLLRHYRRFPTLPGPTVLAYLPHGELYPLLTDLGSLTNLLISLAQRYGRTYALWLGLRRVIVLSHPADILHVATSVADFGRGNDIRAVFEYVAPGGLFTMRHEVHDLARKHLRKDFNYDMLSTFQSHMNLCVEELCSQIHHIASATAAPPALLSDVFDLSRLLATTTFSVITNVAFSTGMSRTDRLEFEETVLLLVEEMMREFIAYPLPQYLEPFGARKRFAQLKKKIYSVCLAFIQKRLSESKEEKEARNPDILDSILELNREKNATTSASLVFEFALAGSHTTSQTVSWAVYEISCDHTVGREIDKELSERFQSRPQSQPLTLDEVKSLPYINKVWKETLRMHPVGSSLLRKCLRDVTLKGSAVRVPKGTNVMALYGSTHMDPSIWTEPDVFKPERWGFGTDRREGERVPAGSYIPFGKGSLSCAGTFLANYEGPLILAELYRRFRFELPCEKDEVKRVSAFLDCPRYASVKGGDFDMGVPMRVGLKEST